MPPLEQLTRAGPALPSPQYPSDHVALISALGGWQHERHRFASRHFLSSQTLEYVARLRSDLSDGARELLHGGSDYRCRFGGASPAVVLATVEGDGRLAWSMVRIPQHLPCMAVSCACCCIRARTLSSSNKPSSPHQHSTGWIQRCYWPSQNRSRAFLQACVPWLEPSV